MKLTEKQKRFADLYIESGNATEAYIKAGYTVKNGSARAKDKPAEYTIKPSVLYTREGGGHNAKG